MHTSWILANSELLPPAQGDLALLSGDLEKIGRLPLRALEEIERCIWARREPGAEEEGVG
jgi:hypothetical protein